jgi:sec-independent protein translocase protein TatA
MFGVGMPELVIVLVLMLVFFGPAKLPQLGSALGGAIRSFRKGAEEEPKVINQKEEPNEQDAPVRGACRAESRPLPLH